MNPRLRSIALAFLLLLAGGWGLYRLFELRFASGDIFPTSSSRRADPIGSKALLDALARQPDLRVTRNLRPLRLLRQGPGTTLFLLGIPAHDIAYPGASPEDNGFLQSFVTRGGRLVVGVEHEGALVATNAARKTARFLSGLGRLSTNAPTALDSQLGFNLSESGAPTNGLASRATDLAGLPASLPWSSVWTLTNTAPPWRTLFTTHHGPVVAERPWGQGTVVVLASDYLLSNEGLRSLPEPALVAWLVGPSREVVFDETHLGLTVEPGIASLIVQYRLTGAVAGLACLVALYLWRNLARFNPPPEPDPVHAVVHGRGSTDGLLNILRRSVAPADLVAVCLAEWRQARGRRAGIPETRIADAQDLVNQLSELPPRERQPVSTYRRIVQILNQR